MYRNGKNYKIGTSELLLILPQRYVIFEQPQTSSSNLQNSLKIHQMQIKGFF